MTARSRKRDANAELAKPQTPWKCQSGTVRRSTRLCQRTSPYFAVKATGTSTKAIRRVKTETKPGVKRSVKSKRKGSSALSKMDAEADAEIEPIAEAVRVHGLARRVNFYGLIQELVTPNVFRLLVATCLLNQTKGRAAMPVFWELLRRWPDEQSLAQADVVELTELLQPIGLHNIRARRLISMSKTMVEIPYDANNSFKSRDRTAPDTPIGIYPGVGRYAIDSWRIFVAGGGASVGLEGEKPVSPFDIATSIADNKTNAVQSASPSASSASNELEWKSVMPLDKELRAYLIWRWAKEGQVWDPLRGVVPASSEA